MPISRWRMENRGGLTIADTLQVPCDSLAEFQNKKRVQIN
jgi:hypothetical protein